LAESKLISKEILVSREFSRSISVMQKIAGVGCALTEAERDRTWERIAEVKQDQRKRGPI